MILTGKKITEEVKSGNIKIYPFDSCMVNPNSYNYRISDHLLEFDFDIIDPAKESKPKQIKLTDSGYVLYPNRLYLAATYESIGSDKYVTSLIGRSSIGRLGLFLQITADLGHQGNNHCWTLELKVVQPFRIYPWMKIGQVSFWEVYESDSCTTLYKDVGHYNSYSRPEPSNFHSELLSYMKL